MESISVIIPMYNASTTIERCLQSVLHQSYKAEYQIIVVNDGSTDNSFQVVESLIKKYHLSNIQIINKINGGVSSARNAGMNAAKGSLIAFLDADDEWLPEKMSQQFEVFKNDPDVVLVGTTINGIILKRYFFKTFSKINVITLNNLLFKNYFSPPTVIMMKKLLDSIGFFDENQRYSEDLNYFMRIAFKHKCILLNKSLSNCGSGKRCFGSSGLSANLKEMENGELKNLRYAYENLGINYFVYSIAVIFSILKYWRRIIIFKLKR